MTGIHGTGLATQTAAGHMRSYAALVDARGHHEQAEHIRFCITQLEKDFMAVRAQRDAARNTAATYEAELHRLESMRHEMIELSENPA